MPHKSDICWKILSYILRKHEDKYNLAILPWTAYLIDYTLVKTDTSFDDSKHWLSFLISWLHALQPAAGLWPKEGLFSISTVTQALLDLSGEIVIASSFGTNKGFIIIAKLVCFN